MAKLETLFFELGLDTKALDSAWKEAMEKYSRDAKITMKVDISGITSVNTGLSTQQNILTDIERTKVNISEQSNKAYISEENLNQAILRTMAAEERVLQQQERTIQEKAKSVIAEEKIAQAKQESIILDGRRAEQTMKTAVASAKLSVEENKIRTEIERANKLSKEQVLIMERAAQVASKTARDAAMESRQKALLDAKITTEAERARQIREITTQAVKNTNRELNEQSRIVSQLKNLAMSYLSIYTGIRLIKSMVQVTGEFELQRRSLQAMIKDLGIANDIFERTKRLALQSPFQFKELITYSKQLAAYSIPINDIYETTKMLSDVSAGLGVDMNRIILAYGQIKSAAVLRGQEIRQLTEAGIPIIDELRKKFEQLGEVGISNAEVFDKVSARLVPFEMVRDVFVDMTTEGGKFYKMQEIQAETLKGKIANLTDAYELMMYNIGNSQSETMKGAVDMVKSLMENYESILQTMKHLVLIYGVYRTAIIAANALEKARLYYLALDEALVNGVNLKLAIQIKLQSALNILKGSWISLLKLGLAAGLGVLYLTYKLITAQTEYQKAMKKVNDAHDEGAVEAMREQIALRELYDKLGKLTEGTAEYEKVRETIRKRYGEHLDALAKEKGAVASLAEEYEYLKRKIEEAAMSRAEGKSLGGIADDRAEKVIKTIKKLDKIIEGKIRDKGMTVEQGAAIRGYIKPVLDGTMTVSNMFLEIAKAEQEALDLLEVPIVTVNDIQGQFAKLLIDFKKEMDKFDILYHDAQKIYARYKSKEGVIASPGSPPSWFGKDNWEEDIGRYAAGLKKFKEIVTKRSDEGTKEFIGRLRDDYKATTDAIKEFSGLRGYDIESLKEKQRVLEGAFKVLGIPALEEKESKKKPEKDPMVDVFTERVAMLEEMTDAYKRMADTLGDERAMAALQRLYAAEGWANLTNATNAYKDDIDKIIEELSKLGEEGQKAAKRISDNLLKKSRSEEVSELIKTEKELQDIRVQASKWADEHASIEEKINTLIKEREEMLSKLTDEREREGVKKEYQSRIDKLQEEAFQLTSFYSKLYGDLEVLSNKSMQNLVGEANKVIASARKVVDKTGRQKVAVDIDGKQYELDPKAYHAFYTKVQDINKKLKEGSPFKSLIEHIKEFNKSGDAEATADWFKEFSVYLSLSFKEVGELGDALSGLFSSIGKEGAAEVVSFATELGEIGVGIVEDIASGNYLAAVAKGIKAIIKVFEFHDNRIEKRIKKSEERVAELENAYNRLSRAMDRALGSDRYDDALKIHKNLVQQTKEVEKQIALEEKKKKIDKERIKSLKGQLDDLRNEMEDSVGSIHESILGSNLKSLADSFGDALFNAIIEGGDAVSVVKDKVDDIIKGITKTMLVQKLVEKPLASIVDRYSTQWFDTEKGFLGFDKLMQTLPSMAKELESFGNSLTPLFSQYIDKLGLASTAGMGGMSSQIKTIQESTANLLASYINAIRADTSINKQSLLTITSQLNNQGDTLSQTLATLASINSNTLRSAKSVEFIADRLNALTSAGGSVKLNTKTYV